MARLARAVRFHPDRRLRAAGLELSGARRSSPARLRPLPDRRKAGPYARLLQTAGLVLHPEPPRQPFRHGNPRRAAPQTQSERTDHPRHPYAPRPKQRRRGAACAGAPFAGRRQGRGRCRHRPQGQVGLRRLHGDRLGPLEPPGGGDRRASCRQAEAGRPRLYPGRGQADRRLGSGRCRRCRRSYLPSRATRLLRTREDVGARDRSGTAQARPRTPRQEAGVRLTIACIGRASRGPERNLYDHYANRIRWPLALRELEEKKKLPPAQLMAREGELLLQAAPAGATLVALDRRGKVLDSQTFADRLTRWRDNSVSDVAFLIGGAEGHAEPLLKKADLVLSFGAMTWPHLLARAMLAEQIYRAQQLLAGHPYHRA